VTSELPVLPHRWPFRFVDLVVERSSQGTDRREGRVLARVSANGRGASGEEWGSMAILVEALAQAAFAVAGGSEGSPEEAGRVFLGGIRDFTAVRPPRAGESLAIDVRLAGAFGAVAKFEGEIRAGEETLARGSILVHRSAGPEG
jgi:3-hydroxymyristoyl/3-hydroxydecanoyl-(acyl carrier protein) dehydratase